MVETRAVQVSPQGTILESVTVPPGEMRAYLVALHRSGGRMITDPVSDGHSVLFSVVYR